jgi:hypothetical protein
MTPFTFQRAAFEKYRYANPRPVIYGVAANIKYQRNHLLAIILTAGGSETSYSIFKRNSGLNTHYALSFV